MCQLILETEAPGFRIYRFRIYWFRTYWFRIYWLWIGYMVTGRLIQRSWVVEPIRGRVTDALRVMDRPWVVEPELAKWSLCLCAIVEIRTLLVVVPSDLGRV